MQETKTIALLASLTAASIACGALAATEPAGISNALKASANEEPAFVLQATGVQIYTCKPKAADATAFQWTFTAPEATLSEGGRTVGRHGAGPTWESDTDRSSVKATVRERQDGGAGNIPWLLLTATSAETEGRFAKVSSIQRVNTRGGVEPSTGCDASKVGEEARVPYTADYYYYRRRP